MSSESTSAIPSAETLAGRNRTVCRKRCIGCVRGSTQEMPDIDSTLQKPNDHSRPFTSTPTWNAPPNFSGECRWANTLFIRWMLSSVDTSYTWTSTGSPPPRGSSCECWRCSSASSASAAGGRGASAVGVVARHDGALCFQATASHNQDSITAVTSSSDSLPAPSGPPPTPAPSKRSAPARQNSAVADTAAVLRMASTKCDTAMVGTPPPRSASSASRTESRMVSSSSEKPPSSR
mmetsp:Transcript_22813/g.59581  ORF Transcript_22813/g.59581 Transcript_22813/m.59581 type:complete len:235 (+) Transcript_22813:289-993(+)